jgi:hypothetical protein
MNAPPADDARFAGPEVGLAVACKNVRDRHPGGLFDLRIGVDEWDREPLRQAAPDRRLAGPHHADKHHRALPERRHDGRLRCRRTVEMVRCLAGHGLGLRFAATVP